MGRMLLLIVVAGSTCALVLWLLAPRLLSSNGSTQEKAEDRRQKTEDTQSSIENRKSKIENPSTNALPNLAPVQSPEQKAVSDYEAQRAPFYAMLQQQFADILVDGRPALDDRSILTLYATRRDATIVTELLTRVVTPYAYAYGFRHVRFYLPNQRGSVEHYALAAEANCDESGHWQAFQHGA